MTPLAWNGNGRVPYSRTAGVPISVYELERRYSGSPAAPLRAVPRAATMIDRKTISIMKACELVGVSRRTIYNWIASGKVEYVRTAGGSVRIFVDTLWRDPRREGELTKEAS